MNPELKPHPYQKEPSNQKYIFFATPPPPNHCSVSHYLRSNFLSLSLSI
jgi:hypothetical protein